MSEPESGETLGLELGCSVGSVIGSGVVSGFWVGSGVVVGWLVGVDLFPESGSALLLGVSDEAFVLYSLGL